ncbi:MAG TPA: DEAD/DEAH box helicase [Clostridia bacterium]
MIKTQLFQHQQEAIEKLLQVKVGALFMDMGTGKTLTALKLFDMRREAGKVDKFVWLAPISTYKNFLEEVKAHTDFEEGRDFHVFGIDSISQSDRIYSNALSTVNERIMLILDESTYIKNPYAKRTQRALALSKQAVYKLVMTGTPITKFVKDLWAQITFLSPLIFNYTTYYQFASNHLIYHKEKGYIVRSANVNYLTKRMSPYVYEKSIEDVVDMPQRTYLTEWYCLSTETRDLYERTKEEILRQAGEYEIDDCYIYKLFTELQKVVSYDPHRINCLDEIIMRLNPDQQTIVWFKYKREREFISKYLKKKSHSYSVFDGDFKQENDFKNKKTRFLLANLQTGSHGQNFQNCYYQIFYSNVFDYASRLQAERRTWRAGQKNKCIYYNIRSNAGIEDLIFNCLDTKSNLLDNFKILTREYNKKYLIEYLRKELSIKDDKDRVEPSGETESHHGIPDESRYSAG